MLESATVANRRAASGATGKFRWTFWLVGAPVLIMAALAAGCHSHEKQQPTKTASVPPPRPAVDDSGADHGDEEPYTVVEAHHVTFHESSGMHLRAEWIEGRLYPTHKGAVPSLDDPSSFKVEVEQGKTAMSVDDLSAALRAGVLKDSRLKGIKIKALQRNELQITGTVHEGVPLPVQLTGDIGATDDGRVSIHIDRLKLLKIPVKGMLSLFHLKPAGLMHLPPIDGVETQGDSLYLRTDKLLPPPRKTGLITSVYFTRDGQLVEIYGHEPAYKPSLADWDLKRWKNYIRLSGGSIRLGKLTLHSTDLTLLDNSPGDWFAFDLARYRDQIMAGDMKMTRSGGLHVFVPDSNKLH